MVDSDLGSRFFLMRDFMNVVGGWAYINLYRELVSIEVAGRDCRDLFGVLLGSRLYGEERISGVVHSNRRY